MFNVTIPDYININSPAPYLELYQYWYNYKFGHAQIIVVPENICPLNCCHKLWNSEGIQFYCDKINNLYNIVDYLKDRGIKSGDIVHLEVFQPFEDEGSYES